MITYLKFKMFLEKGQDLSELNRIAVDYFQFENEECTFGYISNDSIDSYHENFEEEYWFNQRYRDVYAENEFYKHDKDGNQVPITLEEFKKLLNLPKTELTEVGMNTDLDFDFEIDYYELFGKEIKISQHLLLVRY